MGFVAVSGDNLVFANTSSITERLRIDSNGRLLVGAGAIANPKSSGAGSIDLDNQAFSIMVGGNHPSGGRSNNNAKTFRMSMVHYALAEEPINILQGYCDSSDNNVYIGGGTGSANSLTSVRIYTGANTTTTGGTERFRIHSAGQIGLSGANYGTSGQVLTSQGASSAVQWATPSSGAMTLLHTMSISMSSNTQSQSLNLTGYQKLMGTITSLSRSGGVNDSWLTFNGLNASGSYSWVRTYLDNSGDTSTGRSGSSTGIAYGSVGPGFFINLAGIAAADSGNIDAEFTVHNLQDGGRKPFVMTSRSFLTRNIVIDTRGSINTTSAITSIALNVTNAVSRNTGGTIKLYGFK